MSICIVPVKTRLLPDVIARLLMTLVLDVKQIERVEH